MSLSTLRRNIRLRVLPALLPRQVELQTSDDGTIQWRYVGDTDWTDLFDTSTITPPAADILTAIKTVDGTGSGLDADTLDGQHATDFLTHDDGLEALGNLSGTGFVARTGTDTFEVRSITSPAGITVTNPAGVAGDVTLTLDAELVALAGLASAADKGMHFTGSGTAATHDLTSFARTLLDDADAATMRTTLGLVIGTNVQAQDAELAALAGLTSAADKFPYFTGSGTAALADMPSAFRTFLTTPSSANLAAVLSDEAGSGVVPFQSSGTFTPVLNLGGATTGITYTTQLGNYTRIGNRVYWELLITLSSKGSATGDATITGLPVTSATTSIPYSAVVGFINNVTSVTWVAGSVASNSTTIFLYNLPSNTLTNSNLQNTTSLRMSGHYPV